MNINFKTASIATIAAAGLVVGAYTIGVNKGKSTDISTDTTPTTSNQPAQATGTAGKLEPGAQMSSNHPTLVPAPLDSTSTGKSGADTNAKFTHFRVGNRNVKSIFAEKDKVWVGTSGGVIRYDTKNDDYRLFDVRNGLLANGIFSIHRWTDDKLLIGTYGGGLAVYDETLDKFEIFNVPDGLADAFVYDVLAMPNGDMWIATWSGANLVKGGNLADPKAWETYTVENTNGGLPNDWVYGLDIGINGEVWFATEGGLALYDNGKWSNWNHKDGQGASYEMVKADNTFMTDPATVSSHHARQKIEMGLQEVDTAYNPNYIVALEVDKDGIVWVGTWGGGLARFDGKTFKNYTVKDGLPSNHIFMLHEDHKGELWIGTSHGMARFKGDGFEIMTTKDGLFSNTIFSMATQEDGTLWVGSFGGVSRIKVEKS